MRTGIRTGTRITQGSVSGFLHRQEETRSVVKVRRVSMETAGVTMVMRSMADGEE